MYHLIIYTPLTHADTVRAAAAGAGAGRIGAYEACSFSSRGTGRFRPTNDANPAVGTAGQYEETEEERIEVLATEQVLPAVLQAILKVHPYEEPAIHVLPMQDYKTLL